MTTPFPNKFAKPCSNCGAIVPAGVGLTRRVDGKWDVTHNECPVAAQPAVASERVASFTPTSEQLDCVKIFAAGEHLVIQAGAGAGKTSTLKLLAQHAETNGRRGQYTAFNKAIVTEAGQKMPGNVNCATAHSLAFRAVGVLYKHRLGGNRMKSQEVARILGIDSIEIPFAGASKRLAAGWLAGQTMKAVWAFCSSADEKISEQHFAYVEGIDEATDEGERTYANNRELRRYLLPFAEKAWDDLIDPSGRVPFRHDVYLKVWSLSDPKIDTDFILFDEAQDADPVMVSIVEQQLQYGTQIVAVGDSQQSIYEWRGAVDALDRLEKLGGHVAYLTQSFRFGQAVADVANGLLGRIGASLRISGFGAVASTVGPVDQPVCVLARTNAGAVRTVLSTIKDGRKPHLVGGGAEVVSFSRAAKDLQIGRSTQHPELACFANWGEVQEYVESDAQGAELQLMVKLIDDFGADTIIEALNDTKEEHADLVVSTAHKSKGREWDSVQLAGDFFKPKDGGELAVAELRLLYVAITRAKRELDVENVPHALRPPKGK